MTTTARSSEPAEEQRRQRAVEGLPVGPGGRHESLDRITRLARTALGVPMAAVAILDRDRAWFPSSQGLPAGAVIREETFCTVTASGAETLVLCDAADEPLLAHLELVVGGAVRFYAGEPLRDGAGNVLGTLCVFDATPRQLDEEQLGTLRDLAAWAEHELVASVEMLQAGRVQASLLPSAPMRVDGWDVAGLCLPALAVGGDFFDYDVTRRTLHLALGDVMGKGTGAALLSAGVRTALRGTNDAVAAGVDLGIVVTQVARGLLADFESAESFATLMEVAIDLDDGELRYVDAGSGLGLLVGADGSVTRLGGEDRPLGVLPDDHWTEHLTEIEPGGRLLVFSDGLLDLVEDPVRWWEPIGALVADAVDVPALLTAVARLAHAQTALDDITVVAVFRSDGER
ncbi:PP2C family protein-serine/threonine phosphatase [Nocardioides sp. SYSU DS0663]|uniref:PP2C family protein-serine/threonine phosphatase n=1 Tax=Nocardioides sp. SYSU DS0663 TaxID=3416445 RepID=UPI003F4B5564